MKKLERFKVLKKFEQKQQTLEIINKEKDKIMTVNPETGELLHYQKNKLIYDADLGLVDRFSLQSVSRRLLKRYRVSKCLRHPHSNNQIGIHKNSQLNSVFYSGLQTCGSVWHCPVCAAKISERRSEEVKQAIQYTLEQGGQVSFITRTVPHTDQDSLEKILKQFRLAEQKLKSHRNYKKTLKTFCVFGTIKVYELTVGQNGWHLHVHELFLHGSAVPKIKRFHDCLQKNLYSLWKDAAVRSGFDKPSSINGLQVQNGDFAAEYIAKWGKEPQSFWTADKELTKQHIKTSKKGFTPFDLLRLYRDVATFELQDLILEYAQVMYGARQLIWSRGLKDLVNVQDLTDKELVDQIEEEAVLLGVLTLEQWRFICRKDLRVDVLLVAKKHGFSGLQSFLMSLGAPSFDLESHFPRFGT